MNPLVAAGIAVSVAAVLSTAASIEQLLLRSESTSVQEYAGQIDAVELDLDSGDVHVIGSTASEGVVVERTETWSLDRPSVSQELVGGTLRLRAGCLALLAQCEVSYVVRVPAGTRLVGRTGSGSVVGADLGATHVDTGSGDVTLTGVRGAATVRTGSGEVAAVDVRGALSLRSGSGDVVVQGGRTPSVLARTGSGDLVLVLGSPVEQVQAESGSGNVELRVPPGEESYDVQADTGSGDEQVRVRRDTASQRQLRLRTGSGDVVVDYGAPLPGPG